MWVAESYYDGTWQSGPICDEIADFELMLGMHWSWHDLTGDTRGTPAYVRRFIFDLLQIRARCLAQRQAEGAG